ncbi:ParB/RepB/Spo0J family partition protein [Clostridium perfringens]|uniref:ParB/RepB/Spo0J family partition protein n=1 Tax=Clostridium perfringens TaxID=1502 RepID=UPI000BBA6644|nr:ParB/RepB/Spo0J family partition protein [Clostridium perfringens]MBS5969916.1 ParB/RepB/Spo0J family partition protein [Clostridium perfringens]MCI2779898.1 ParB/RepB/Spo0J family partition protein [Clostridium perfringens]MCX0371441.1 ParB/RepB/Spo0J family partition protein [Clostridium perfringens]MCX0380559.1 ParB/RepB/Spo0J family partition protein [Clostridium perfringens]MDM0472126.1 ParB/RepB/Spo0J family partition protein [Clostridium perfringens]
MAKKFGLGKGLGALIPEDNSIKEEKNENGGIINIELKDIKANKKQPRKFFDNNKLNELAESVKEHGIIQPLILKKEEKGYSIIAGERRYRAAKIAELTEVPALIMDISDEKLLQVSLIENIQREDLNPIEEGLAYERLLKEFALTQEELSKTMGKSRTTITNTMRLLKLDDRVKEYVIEGVISEGHGRAILPLENDAQYEIAQKIIDNSLSVRETEKLVKRILNDAVEEKTSERRKPLNPYYKDVRDRLQDHFGTKVNLNANKNKGKIEIEYYSEEDLQRILDIINI